MSAVLGLDLSQHTGWAFAGSDGTILGSGTEEFLTKKCHPALRFMRFRLWFAELVRRNNVSLVAYEIPHLRGMGATAFLLGLSTRVEEQCAIDHIPCENVHTGTLKVFATGHGKASKEEMIRAAEKVVGRKLTSDDEADAIHVARWAAAGCPKPKKR